MKTLISLIAMLFATPLCYSQNTAWSTSGAIGINTTTPNGPLEVAGRIVISGNNANLDINIPTSNLDFLKNSGKMLIGWNRTQGAGETDFFANQGGGSVGGYAFYNYNNSGVEKQLMWLTGDGRLMLGLSTGATGNNKLAVGGGIIGESVTVKLQANWPDYVFKPTYQLKPLSEVKTYIDQNQHLPEMPSASEVEKAGLNLGEMVKLQTKKIEELTLYLIEKDKEIKELKQQTNVKQSQQKQIDELNKKLEILLSRKAVQ